MRLSEWVRNAPVSSCVGNEVLAVLQPVLVDLGAERDPKCWILWGQDPDIRYSVMVPAPSGLILAGVRPNAGGEGPRASGKLVRWSKLNLGEINLESAGGHRIVVVQVEGQVLKGTDEEADRVCEFYRHLLEAIDGRAYVAAPSAHAAAPTSLAASRAPAPSGSLVKELPAPRKPSGKPSSGAPSVIHAPAPAAASAPTAATEPVEAPEPAKETPPPPRPRDPNLIG